MTTHLPKWFYRSALVLALSSMVAGCASVQHPRKEPIPQDHFAEIQRPEIPLIMNNRVQDWLNYFQGRGRPHFERYLKRSVNYIPMMRKILRQNGLPDNLVYLSMIESGFNPHAYSSARAAGAWQFIYATGIRYGLKSNSWVDERRDPEKSTVAAAKYLKDLYDRYNNWYLAAAGYNAGEGKINRAIRKYATEDFWGLSKGSYLKPETKDYVPKLIAAAMIAKNPKQYGFEDVNYENPILLDDVIVRKPMDLRVIAKLSDLTYDEVKASNPELIHWVTPPEVRDYRLKLPKSAAHRFKDNVGKLKDGDRFGDQKKILAEEATVSEVAADVNLPPILIAEANDTTLSGIFKKGDTVAIPMDPPAGDSFYEVDYVSRRKSRNVAYRTKKGDTLNSVARNYGVTPARLRSWNPGVNWSNLKPGQRVTLRLESKGKSVRGKKISGKKSRSGKSKGKVTRKKAGKKGAKAPVRKTSSSKSKRK